MLSCDPRGPILIRVQASHGTQIMMSFFRRALANQGPQVGVPGSPRMWLLDLIWILYALRSTYMSLKHVLSTKYYKDSSDKGGMEGL